MQVTDVAIDERPGTPYELAFASLPEATLLVDEVGRIRGANEAAVRLLGSSVAVAAARGEPVGRALPWLEPVVDRALDSADEAGLEADVGSSPEGALALDVRVRRVCNDLGQVRGVLVVLEDVGVRRALAARQRSAERLAALGTLAAGLAHEVNNPLACVVAGLAFLEAEHGRLAAALGPTELEEARLALEEAQSAAVRVGRVVRSLQSFGQSSAPFLAEVDVSPAIARAAELAAPEVEGRASLVLEIAAEARVRASEPLLVELFLALITNAAQAIPPGNPTGHTVRIELGSVEGEAWVVVSDNGPGISGEVLERAFDPFFTTRPGQSTGLGLSVSHGIVTALGGSLTLGGSPGHGTTATVRLPLAT